MFRPPGSFSSIVVVPGLTTFSERFPRIYVRITDPRETARYAVPSLKFSRSKIPFSIRLLVFRKFTCQLVSGDWVSSVVIIPVLRPIGPVSVIVFLDCKPEYPVLLKFLLIRWFFLVIIVIPHRCTLPSLICMMRFYNYRMKASILCQLGRLF